jgi:predicted dehydrogenase
VTYVSEQVVPRAAAAVTPASRPRLGFLGVGWIGRHRLEAIARSGAAEIVSIAEPHSETAALAADLAPDAALVASLDELLESRMDGVVIATPSALHAVQAVSALESGIAVFCQKPLGRNTEETRRVVEAARRADRLLCVDFTYRFIPGVERIMELIAGGELGRVYAADLVFHNAYGPDKPWFYRRELSGGGCVIDLGIHLVDLAFRALDFPRVARVSSRLFAGGEPLDKDSDGVEDYATARLDLEGGAVARLACSWKLHAGRDAVIEASFYGTRGGASLRNREGSFYDFTAERFSGTSREVFGGTADEGRDWRWGGRAAVEWVQRLAAGEGYDPACARLVDVAATLDAIYDNRDE